MDKEKVRDQERSKESKSNQLARRAGEKDKGEKQKKVKDRERSEEPKCKQLSERAGEKETDEGENQKRAQLLKSGSRGKE